jgi:SAM-dependent MidA family methyltransferase
LKELVEKIAEKIAAQRVISFKAFMELALYCPVYGYYERDEDSVGKRGDYFTSVSVGRLFGHLLAFQFAQWTSEYDETPIQIVEAGAHTGVLARDILEWLREHRGKLFERLDYFFIDPSPERRQWQEKTLAEFGTKTHWARDFNELKGLGHAKNIRGIIFANELLDALPVHRVGWDARERKWFEWGVTWKEGRFAWAQIESVSDGALLPGGSGSDPQEQPGLEAARAIQVQSEAERGLFKRQFDGLQELPAELLKVLPDGFTTELCPAAELWWFQAASALERGKLVTLDYGLEAEEFFSPARPDGTLRAYHRHSLSADPLARPGAQDLTTHVNFTAVRKAGESAGLLTESFATQAQFLTGIASQVWKGEFSFGGWTEERTGQFKTLVHPEHLGQKFKVLVQSRGKGDCSS